MACGTVSPDVESTAADAPTGAKAFQDSERTVGDIADVALSSDNAPSALAGRSYATVGYVTALTWALWRDLVWDVLWLFNRRFLGTVPWPSFDSESGARGRHEVRQ